VGHKAALINTENILQVSAASFEGMALGIFGYQHANNPLYRAYCDALRVDARKITTCRQIPFLPISFFKTHRVVTGEARETGLVFESSGTTGETPSRHYIADAGLYESSLLGGFEQFYGRPEQYAILALLPSYLERKNASLVHMARVLMEKSGHTANGFYINEWQQLSDTLKQLEQAGQKTLLLGVTFALLDFAAAMPMPLRNTIVMETGGMKGRREEMTRKAVHDELKERFGLQQVHSEYGMTELLSQAYAPADGLFSCTNTMRVMVRDMNDPLDVTEAGAGCLNIIDLANINSCSFIATDDIGKIYADGTFEVLGRMDHSALRGCSLMAV
jgi:phenylacetate-coenzyme A ligase PaaK-like adenylate-forming protein